MRITRNKASGLISRALGLALAFGLSLTLFAGTATAITGGGATILNVATVDYQDASATGSFQATSSASVTVGLIAAPPVLSTPADQAIASATTATYSYTVTATANGVDTYDITTPISAQVDLGGTGAAAPSGATITLGASVILSNTATTIDIPAGSGTNFVAGTTVLVVGGTDYLVNTIVGDIPPSHTNNLGAYTTAGVTTNETPITITLVANPAPGSNVAPAFGVDAFQATVAGEQATFTVAVDGTVLAPAIAGTATVDTNVASQTDGAQDDTHQTITTFQDNFVSIEKLVQNTASPGFAATATGVTGDTLEYQITMNNTSAANATSVFLTDPLPAYTNYVPGSTRLNGITVNGDGAASPLFAAPGLAIDDDGGRGAGVVATGIIGGLSSAVVTFQVTIQ